MQQLREHTARGLKIYLKKQITARFVASDHSWAFGFRHPSSSHLANFNDPGTLQKLRNGKVRIDSLWFLPIDVNFDYKIRISVLSQQRKVRQKVFATVRHQMFISLEHDIQLIHSHSHSHSMLQVPSSRQL